MTDISNVSPTVPAGLVSQTPPTPTSPNASVSGDAGPVHNVGEFKEKAPGVYDAMMKAMAWQMIGDMRKHEAKMKKISQGDLS